MNIKVFLLCIVFSFTNHAFSQSRIFHAVKIDQPVKIDGILNEDAWKTIEPQNGFKTYQPVSGKPASQQTDIRIAYDNSSIYIGAILHDSSHLIRRQYCSRDGIYTAGYRIDADYLVLGFDTYLDKQNAFIFLITASGVQCDARETQNSSTGFKFDASWDAVWESKVSITENGWVAEVRIPYSALRFSGKDIQDWGFNAGRMIRRHNEVSTWSPQDINVGGDVNQWGTISGLKGLTPPLRLSFLPYLSGGVTVSPTNNGNITEYPKSGGMDVKYGINKSFTLDMTLVPDFAQVQSDNKFLNLTPFQIKFEDFRPFFTEGIDLFNKAGLFYSRRIGASPVLSSAVLNKYGNNPDYSIEKNPGITKLYNATKFSGRTQNDLGIGVLNAVTAPMYARVRNKLTNSDSSILTEPLTNYNIVVFDQALKNRSSVTFTNTNVLRKGNSRNANVAGIDLSFFDKHNKYNYLFSAKHSSIWGKVKQQGYIANGRFSKVSGNWQYSAFTAAESDKYDPNDLGFLQNNNSFVYGGNLSYNYFKRTKNLINYRYNINVANSYLYKPFKWTEFELSASAFYLFKNFFDLRLNFVTSPIWYNDYFVNTPVYTGHFLKRTPFYYFGFNGSTDSRKKLHFAYQLGGAESPLPRDPYWRGDWTLRYRVTSKTVVSANYSVEQDRGAWGWAYVNNSDGSPVIARRNVKQATSLITAQHNFTARQYVTFRLRHYWSIVENTNFYNLKTDGYWTERPFMNGLNINSNIFNIDMFYIWDFLPGSRLTVAWKNALGNNVAINPYTYASYGKNVSQVFNNPHSNELSVKLVYYLDYLSLKKK